MSEEKDPQTTEPGDGEASENPAKGTPSVGNDDQKLGQTQSPAADDEVGVPDDVGQDERTP